MPGEVQLGECLLAQVLKPEARQDALQVMAVQHVELGERQAAGTDFLHAGLVFRPPGVGEGDPVEVIPQRPELGFRLPGHGRPPIHQGAEDVEEEGFDGRMGVSADMKALACSPSAGLDGLT